MTIRTARVTDIPDAAELLKETVETIGLADFAPVDDSSIWHTLYGHVANKTILVVEEEKLLGVATWFLSRPYWNQTVLSGHNHYIILAEEARGKGLGKELAQAREDRIIEQGATVILSDMTNNSKIGPIYEAMGYKQFQVNYIKRVR